MSIKNNVMHEGIFTFKKEGRDILFVNADKCEHGNVKIIVLPWLTLGEQVINVLVEYYSNDYVCTKSGISARNGWHEEPIYKLVWNKKPYNTETITVESFKRMFENIELQTI